MVGVPVLFGVYVTWQLLLLEFTVERLQEAELKDPAPVGVQVTVPVGALAVPVSVSVTVAEQVVGTSLTVTVAGEQSTLVEVVRLLTTWLSAEEVLPL